MTEKTRWDIRTLLDGYSALRNLLASLPATAVPPDLLIRLAAIERKLRPVDELTRQRREALAREYGLGRSPDGQRFTPPEGEGGSERFQEYLDGVDTWLSTEYPIEFEPVAWSEAVEKIRGLTALHFAVMPFAFSITQGETGDDS